MRDGLDGTFQASDGSVIEYSQHAAPDPDAPRVALIHSLALDRSFWNGVVAELKAHARLLTYDCRGHGHSGREAENFNVGLFARDLAELLDHTGWPDATVAGCSMGGCVAQAFAALYPERAKSICLIDTTAWYGADAPRQWRERAATARTKGMGALVEFQTTRWFGDAFRAAQFAPRGELVAGPESGAKNGKRTANDSAITVHWISTRSPYPCYFDAYGWCPSKGRLRASRAC